MANLGELTVYLRADMRDFSTKLQKATKNLKKFTIKTKGLLRANAAAFKSLGRAVQRIGSTIGKWVKRMSIALVAAISLSIKAFADFEEQIANVSTMLDDSTMRYMPKYAKQLKNMAVKFGESTKTLSKGLYDILSASIAPAKALDVLAVSTIAAKAGMTNTGIAADAITTILNSYGYAAEDAGKISDIFFAIVKRGKTTFAQLAPAIGKVASTAAIANVSFEELGAAIATMTRAGLQTDVTMTSIRGIMLAFLKPSKEAIEMAKQFGFELNTTTLKAIGLTGVLKKLKGATAEQLAAIIPNVRGMAGFAAALKQAEGMASDLDLMLHSTGLTQKAFAKMTDTLAFQLKRLWQAIKIISVGVGERFKKSIIDLTTSIIKNRYVIEDWAVAFADRIVFVRDVMWNFLRLMKVDWKAGTGVALNTVLELFVGFGKSLSVIMKNAAIDAANAFTQNFGESLGRWLIDVGGPKGVLGKLSLLSPVIAAGRIAIMEAGAGLMEKAAKPSPPSKMKAELKAVADATISNIKRISKAAEEATGIDVLTGPLNKLQLKDAQRQIQTWWRNVREFVQPTIDAVIELKNQMLLVLGFGRKVSKPEPLPRTPAKGLRGSANRELSEAEKTIRQITEAIDEELLITGRLNETRERSRDLVRLQIAAEKAFGAESKKTAKIMDEYRKKLKRLELMQDLADMAERMGDSFANAFEDMVFEAKKFGDVMTALLRDIAREIMRTFVTQPLARGIAGYIGGMFGGAPGQNIKTTPAGDVNPRMANVAHSGGIVGAGMAQRKVPEMVFSKAPRLHAGLQPDEFPAILQRGETVISKNDIATQEPPKIIINNNTGQSMEQERAPEFDGEKWVVSIVAKNINQYGLLRNLVQGVR